MASFAIVCYIPFDMTIAPKREFTLIDSNGEVITRAQAIQTWYQYSLNYSESERIEAGEYGKIVFPSRILRVKSIDLISGAFTKILEYKLHASVTSSDTIAIFADGYNHKFIYDSSSVRLTFEQFQLLIRDSNFVSVTCFCKHLINQFFLEKRYAQNL